MQGRTASAQHPVQPYKCVERLLLAYFCLTKLWIEFVGYSQNNRAILAWKPYRAIRDVELCSLHYQKSFQLLLLCREGEKSKLKIRLLLKPTLSRERGLLFILSPSLPLSLPVSLLLSLSLFLPLSPSLLPSSSLPLSLLFSLSFSLSLSPLSISLPIPLSSPSFSLPPLSLFLSPSLLPSSSLWPLEWMSLHRGGPGGTLLHVQLVAARWRRWRNWQHTEQDKRKGCQGGNWLLSLDLGPILGPFFRGFFAKTAGTSQLGILLSILGQFSVRFCNFVNMYPIQMAFRPSFGAGIGSIIRSK